MHSAVLAGAAFVVAGAGMGFGFSRTGVAMLAASTDRDRGFNSSALSIADSIGAALALSLCGIGFALTERAGGDPFLAVFGVAVVAAAGAVVTAWRIRPGSLTAYRTWVAYGEFHTPSTSRSRSLSNPSNSRLPPPSTTGAVEIASSSTTPADRPWRIRSAPPPSATTPSPASSRALTRAASKPSTKGSRCSGRAGPRCGG